jgi:hypothetical protein
MQGRRALRRGTPPHRPAARSVGAEFERIVEMRYQGELKQNGAPVTASTDMVFRLYDAASNGTQIGTGLQFTAVRMAVDRRAARGKRNSAARAQAG